MAYENNEKYDMLECFILSNNSADIASQTYLTRYPERRQPHKYIFQRLKENLINYGSFTKPRPKNYNIEDADDATINVIGAVVVDPSTSSRQIEAETGVSRRRALKILKKNKFRPYAIRKQQQLLAGDSQRRLEFCNWYQQRCLADPIFSRKIIWTDEAYISSAGVFNRHNHHYWSDVNPHITVDIQNQGRFGFSVWCAILENRILGLQIYEEHLNGQRYHQILSQNIIDNFLDELPVVERRNYFFQQDGAPPHNTRIVSELLNDYFRDNWIGTNGPVRWPARSPDLTPLDFFFWGYIKDHLYQMDNNNINQLRQNFQDCIESISNIHIQNAVNSVLRRCNLCVANNGEQFEKFL